MKNIINVFIDCKVLNQKDMQIIYLYNLKK